jgi:hypothetical protein
MRHVAEFAHGGRLPLVRSQFQERLPSGGDGTGELLTMEELINDAYLPWLRYARRYSVTQTATLKCVVWPLVVGRKGLRQVANDIGIDQRRAERLARRGLSVWGDYRGWPSAAAEELC